jgi:hypothetical protein
LRTLGAPDRADDRCALGDRAAALHGDFPEMKQRRGVPERRFDRDGLPAGRHGAGERHHPVDRRSDRRSLVAADVDAAVLPARIRMRGIEEERTKDRSVDRPRPRLR